MTRSFQDRSRMFEVQTVVSTTCTIAASRLWAAIETEVGVLLHANSRAEQISGAPLVYPTWASSSNVKQVVHTQMCYVFFFSSAHDPTSGWWPAGIQTLIQSLKGLFACPLKNRWDPAVRSCSHFAIQLIVEFTQTCTQPTAPRKISLSLSICWGFAYLTKTSPRLQ